MYLFFPCTQFFCKRKQWPICSFRYACYMRSLSFVGWATYTCMGLFDFSTISLGDCWIQKGETEGEDVMGLVKENVSSIVLFQLRFVLYSTCARFEPVKSPEVTLCAWLDYKPSINKYISIVNKLTWRKKSHVFKSRQLHNWPWRRQWGWRCHVVMFIQSLDVSCVFQNKGHFQQCLDCVMSFSCNKSYSYLLFSSLSSNVTSSYHSLWTCCCCCS